MTKRSNGVEAPGVDIQEVEIPSVDVIEKWITKDVAACISFLNALHSDVELRKQLAVWIQGRYSNRVNKPDPNQINLGL